MIPSDSPSANDCLLYLADGYTARGRVFGKPGTTTGKLVFNTSMWGYHEILTDPSYAGEIICFTFPLIGIAGICPADAQSSRIHARGLIVGELAPEADNWRADRTLNDLAMFEGLTGISGIDTRRLTRHLRERGEMLGVITSELTTAEAAALLESQPDFGSQDLVREVSCKAPYVHKPRADWLALRGHSMPTGEPRFRVAAYDFGIKRGILDCLAERGCETHVFPATATAAELLAIEPDGVFLSNGPGDPERMDYALPHVLELIERSAGEGRPVFGICLGHQLIARAMGLPTYRLKFGNRGGNHPVLDLESGLAHISSQNHSYAVALSGGPEGRPAAAADGAQRAPLPVGPARPGAPFAHPLNSNVLVTQLNINDSSCEGLSLRGQPVFSVQYHPEGCPGPRDNTYLFDRFVEMMAESSKLPALSGPA